MIIGKINNIHVQLIDKYSDVGEMSISDIYTKLEEAYHDLLCRNVSVNYFNITVFEEKRIYRNAEYIFEIVRCFIITPISIYEYQVVDNVKILDDELGINLQRYFHNYHGKTEPNMKSTFDSFIDFALPESIVKDAEKIGKLQKEVDKKKKLLVKYA